MQGRMFGMDPRSSGDGGIDIYKHASHRLKLNRDIIFRALENDDIFYELPDEVREDPELMAAIRYIYS